MQEIIIKKGIFEKSQGIIKVDDIRLIGLY